MVNNLYKCLAFSLLFLTGCSSVKETHGVWINKEKLEGKSFSKIFIVALTADIQARVRIEKGLAQYAESKGYGTVKSIDALPVSLDNPEIPQRESIVQAVQTNGCDAVFVASVIKEAEAIKYVPDQVGFTTAPYYTWYGNFLGYYSNMYQTVSVPGYYAQDQKYIIQSSLFDTKSQELMWTAHSSVFNPTSLDKFTQAYVSTLVEQLEKEKILKK